nr:hypothetical protein [Aureimonas leprariae]
MRTLALNPDVMLLDAPFGAPDSQTRLAMQQWLLAIWAEEKRTVVFAAHDIDEAILLGDRVVVMSPRPGRIERILPVPLARPQPMSVLTDPVFNRLKREILCLIYGSVPADALAHPLDGPALETDAGNSGGTPGGRRVDAEKRRMSAPLIEVGGISGHSGACGDIGPPTSLGKRSRRLEMVCLTAAATLAAGRCATYGCSARRLDASPGRSGADRRGEETGPTVHRGRLDRYRGST